jgi:alpha/beta superfamily hydrolase
MISEQPVTLDVGAGVVLDARVALPPGARAGVVLCHPHPLYGGDMDSIVVLRAREACARRGLATLRFNFRGVGASTGRHDEGRGEQDDVRAALAELERRFPGSPVILGGFSFGASMALHVGVADSRARALFALGLPLTRTGDLRFMDDCRKPRLFVQGEADAFGGAQAVEAFVGRLPEPRHLVVVPGADHFFDGRLDALQDAVAAWAAERPWEDR